MKTLSIGVVGTGHMGLNHVRSLSEDNRFNLVGIYDANPEQASRIAQRYGIEAASTLEELLDKVEAVVVAVPSSLHKKIGLVVAGHKVHALIEKPLAITSQDAEDLVAAFENNGLKLQVGHIERYNPVFKELQKLVNPDNIFYTDICRYSPFSGSGRITDTSVVEDLMIHDVDLLCTLLGNKEISSIESRGEIVFSDRIDFATCMFDFKGSSHAVVHASRVSQNKERKIIIHSTDCCIQADLLAKTLDIYKNTNITVDLSDSSSYKQDGVVQKIYVPIEEPLKAEHAAFYNAIVQDTPIEVDGRAGVNAIKICEQIVKNIYDNRESA